MDLLIFFVSYLILIVAFSSFILVSSISNPSTNALISLPTIIVFKPYCDAFSSLILRLACDFPYDKLSFTPNTPFCFLRKFFIFPDISDSTFILFPIILISTSFPFGGPVVSTNSIADGPII